MGKNKSSPSIPDFPSPVSTSSSTTLPFPDNSETDLIQVKKIQKKRWCLKKSLVMNIARYGIPLVTCVFLTVYIGLGLYLYTRDINAE